MSIVHEDQRRRPPRAVNIIGPSSPILRAFHQPHLPHGHSPLPPQSPATPSLASFSTASSVSTISLNDSVVSTMSPAQITFSQPHFFGVAPPWLQGAKNFLPAHPDLHTHLSRMYTTPRFSGSASEQGTLVDDSVASDKDDQDTDVDQDDPWTGADDEEDMEAYVAPKIVARVTHGTILNGRGEMIVRGGEKTTVYRKIADLEREKMSLMTDNENLESVIRSQAERIAMLEKQIEAKSLHSPPHEIMSEKDNEEDYVFERIKQMLKHLIEQAQEAINTKTKTSGRVLTFGNNLPPQPTPSVNYTPGDNRSSQAAASRKNRQSWPTVTSKNSRLMKMAMQSPPTQSGRTASTTPRPIDRRKSAPAPMNKTYAAQAKLAS